MRYSKSKWIALPAAVALALAVPAIAEEQKPLQETLEELLPGMGAEDIGARRGPQQDWQTICWEAGAPGNEARRLEVSKLMAERLGGQMAVPARVWLLEQLGYIGREECVAAVAAQVGHEDPLVCDAARRALARIPASEAGAVLREKLAATKDNKRKVALINALGYRAEAASAGALAKELGCSDQAVACAAADALGKTGTPEAARALADARKKAQGELRLCVGNAYLLCADKLAAQGKTVEAAAMYRELYEPGEPARLAALAGMIDTAGDGAGAIILKVLAGDDVAAQQTAITRTGQIPDAAVRTLVEGMEKLPPAGQMTLLGALASRGEKSALPAVLAALKCDEACVKMRALEALGAVGDVSVVPMLVEKMMAGGDEGGAAREALQEVGGKDADTKLVEIMKKTDDAGQRRTLVEILERRRAVAAVPALLEEAMSDDAALRRRAMEALGRLGNCQAVRGMIKAMCAKEQDKDRQAAERAIAMVCLRTRDTEQQATPVITAYKSASDEDKQTLLRIAGRIGGGTALDLLRQELSSSNEALRDGAVRGICNWPDATVVEDLVKIAEKGSEDQKVAAVRAMARVIVLESDVKDKVKLEQLKRAMQLATRDQDRNLILDRARTLRLYETFQFVLPYLDKPAMAVHAGRTIVDLAHHGGLRGKHKDEYVQALERIIRQTKDRGLADRAKRELGSK